MLFRSSLVVVFPSHDKLCELGGVLRGVVRFTERPFADRVWELQMIAVDGAEQRRGIGSLMLGVVEAEVRQRGGRLLLIETSDQGSFERTRQEAD